jgi:hypothetical protein
MAVEKIEKREKGVRKRRPVSTWAIMQKMHAPLASKYVGPRHDKKKVSGDKEKTKRARESRPWKQGGDDDSQDA